MKILPSPLPVSQSVGMRQPKFHNIEVTKLGGSSMRKLPLVILGLILSLATSPAVGHEKFRIAVGGLIISPALTEKQEKAIRNSSLLSNIETALRGERKFEVLARRAELLEPTLEEQDSAKSGFFAGNAAAEGRLDNAQALVMVEVTRFSFGRSAEPVPNTRKHFIRDSCSLALTAQIIDTTSGAILGAFPVKESASSAERIVNSVGSASPAIMDKVLEKAAAAVGNAVTETVYPMKVIAVKGSLAWVDRGDSSSLKPGEVLRVFKMGDELRDPYTGELLGHAEMEVGRAKVREILPKVSVVELIKCAGDVQSGCVLRRMEKR